MSDRPKYEIIKQTLITDIISGKLSPGMGIPSETELMNTFSVSRITVRRAIDELYREGYIEKKQGKRACVRNAAKTQELASIFSYTEEIVRQGMMPSRKILCEELRLGTLEEQEKLQLDKADPVYFLKRIIYADGQPLCYTMTTLPYKIFRDIETFDFHEHSLYSIIEGKYPVKITTSRLKLKAIPAKKEMAQYLDVEDGSPLLYSTATTYGIYNGEEVPIETFHSYYLTDRFEYSLIQTR